MRAGVSMAAAATAACRCLGSRAARAVGRFVRRLRCAGGAVGLTRLYQTCILYRSMNKSRRRKNKAFKERLDRIMARRWTDMIVRVFMPHLEPKTAIGYFGRHNTTTQ